MDIFPAVVAKADQWRVGAFGRIFDAHRRCPFLAPERRHERFAIGPWRDFLDIDAGDRGRILLVINEPEPVWPVRDFTSLNPSMLADHLEDKQQLNTPPLPRGDRDKIH